MYPYFSSYNNNTSIPEFSMKDGFFLERAYSLLGVPDSADLEEIEAAYRSKKRLYAPERFEQGSSEWLFAHARNKALDEAHRYAVDVFWMRRRNLGEDPDDFEGEVESEDSPLGELLGLVFVCPIAVYCMQLLVPTILSDLAPGGIRGATGLLDIVVLFLSYLFPAFLRFKIFKRPIRRFFVMLCLFPLTLICADFFTSALLHFSRILPGSGFRYVPFFYLVGLGPLFILFYAHCAILKMSFHVVSRKNIPFFRRLAAYTVVLALSMFLSMGICVAFNGEEIPPAAGNISAAAKDPDSPVLEEPWQILELWNAGVMEIPGSWYVEDSNGKHSRIQHGNTVQHIREALIVRPYGQREEGLDFALELLVYWWTNLNEKILPLPERALERTQEHQFESLQRSYPDIVSYKKTRTEHNGLVVDTVTTETRSIPGHVVRFKNIAFMHENRLYTLMVGYPAYEEQTWEVTLDRLLWRWQPGT